MRTVIVVIPVAMVMTMATQTVMTMSVAMTIMILIMKNNNDKDKHDHDENYHTLEETLHYNKDKAYGQDMIIFPIFIHISGHKNTWNDLPSLISFVLESIMQSPHHQMDLPFCHEYCGFTSDAGHFYAVLCQYNLAMLWIWGFHGHISAM